MASKINSFVLMGLIAVISLTIVSGFAGAVTTLDIVPASIALTAEHNSAVVVNFNVTHNSQSAVNQTLIWAGSSSSGSWQILPSLSSINVGETKSASATFSIPQGASGQITAQLNLTSATSSTPTVLPVTFTINSTPSFTITKTQDTGKSRNGTFTINNNGNVNLNLVLTSSGAFTVSFMDGNTIISPGSSVSVAKSQPKVITVVPVNVPALGFGTHTITVTANDSVNAIQRTESFSIVEGFCRSGAIGTNISISQADINNLGDEDETWLPLDNVVFKVDVDNKGASRIRDVVVEMGLFDSSGKNVASKLSFSNADDKKISLGTINEGNDDRATFEFRVPADIDSGNYKLAVKAYSKDLGEDNLCTDSSSDLGSTVYQQIRVDKQDDEGKFIAFDNVRISPVEAICGDAVTLSFDAFNVGDSDQDQVKIKLFSRDLAVNQEVEIKQGLNQGDKQSMVMNFAVPEGLQDKSYPVDLSAEYDYNNGVYRESSDESTKLFLKVFGCNTTAAYQSTGIVVTASLASEAKAGQEMTVSTVVKNTDTQQKIYTFDVKGFDSWATLNSVSERIFLLNAGESKTVQIILTPKSSVSGDQTFTVEARSGDKVATKQVAVNIAKSAGFSFSSFGENKVAWIIGIVNVILIILIVFVAVRLSRA